MPALQSPGLASNEENLSEGKPAVEGRVKSSEKENDEKKEERKSASVAGFPSQLI